MAIILLTDKTGQYSPMFYSIFMQLFLFHTCSCQSFIAVILQNWQKEEIDFIYKVVPIQSREYITVQHGKHAYEATHLQGQ